MKKLLAISLLFFSTFIAFGSNQADTIKVYFRVGSSQFEPEMRDNGKVMNVFIDDLKEADNNGELDSVIIRAYASPEGYHNTNLRLTSQRCQSISDYIVLHSDINQSIIKSIPEGIAWKELRELVETTPGVPKREKILDILDNTPVWVYNSAGKVISGRKKKLMELDGGKPYNWMLTNLFPELRNAVAVSLYFKKNDKHTEIKPECEEKTEENVIIGFTHDPVDRNTQSTEETTTESVTKFCGNDRFAIKNNFLYDAALMPNLEFEWLINNNWSVAVEGGVAWWKNAKRHKYYQLAYVSPEVRYHIRPRAAWHGMYVGIFTGGGKYDLENGGTGYKGEGGMVGASFGYMWPIGKHLSLEAAIGAGYMFTRYKEYEPREGHYLYLRTKDLHYFGPLKLKFAIAWRFGAKCKPILNQSAL